MAKAAGEGVAARAPKRKPQTQKPPPALPRRSPGRGGGAPGAGPPRPSAAQRAPQEGGLDAGSAGRRRKRKQAPLDPCARQVVSAAGLRADAEASLREDPPAPPDNSADARQLGWTLEDGAKARNRRSCRPRQLPAPGGGGGGGAPKGGKGGRSPQQAAGDADRAFGGREGEARSASSRRATPAQPPGRRKRKTRRRARRRRAARRRSAPRPMTDRPRRAGSESSTGGPKTTAMSG